MKEPRGYFGIGIYQPKTRQNVGTLWRSAYQMGADFIFIIGKKYSKQSSDTYKSWKHIPLIQFQTLEDFRENAFYDCRLICVEFCEDSTPLRTFKHPERCIYLLGAEDNGLPSQLLNDKSVLKIELPSIRQPSYNVAVAGSLVMFDRMNKSSLTSTAGDGELTKET